MKLFRIIAALAILVLLVPIMLPLIAMLVAQSQGCRMNEGGSTPCVIFGHDFGDMFGFLAVLPWMSFFILPAAALVVVCWIIVEIVRAVSRRK